MAYSCSYSNFGLIVVTCLVRLLFSWLKTRKEIGERWKALPSDKKKRFVEMAKASVEEHTKVVPCAPKSEKVITYFMFS